MRKLYLFVNQIQMPEFLDCMSLTDDGTILGGHICSHMCFMMHDLHDRADRLEKIKAHFNNQDYEVEIVSYEQCKSHIEFQKAIELAKNKKQVQEDRGVRIEFDVNNSEDKAEC